MKRLIAILLAIFMVLSLVACNDDNPGGNETEPTDSASYEIDWQTLPDNDIIGAWEPTEDSAVSNEVVLFTMEGIMRVVYGTIVFDADITYGEDGYGTKSAYTQSSYLYGQWSYTIENGVLTIQYPSYDSETGEATFTEKVFNSVSYTPITLIAKEDFAKEDSLVGTWTNSTYGDSYQFTEDGYAIFNLAVDDGVYLYDTEIKYCYTVEGNEITFYYYDTNGGEETSETFEYSIDGTKLFVGESDYYLNGEGEPEPTEADTVVYAY